MSGIHHRSQPVIMTERDQDCALLEGPGETEMGTGMEEVLIVRINLRFPCKPPRLLPLLHRGEIDVIVEERQQVKEGSF